MSSRNFISLSRYLIAIICALLLSPSATAGEEKRAIGPAPPINILDGKRFAGEFVPAGESSGPTDDFIFSDGKFHSTACLNWGFEPGPYWVRVEGGEVHFWAKLTSAENGVMTYRGTIRGPKIDARIEWIKPRWYWTMEKTFSFQGMHGEAAASGK